MKPTKYQVGGSVYDYMESKGLDGSYQNRKRLFNNLFDGKYAGTAEQNMQLLEMLKSGKTTLPTKAAPSKPQSKPSAPVQEDYSGVNPKAFKVAQKPTDPLHAQQPYVEQQFVNSNYKLPIQPVNFTAAKESTAQKPYDVKHVPHVDQPSIPERIAGIWNGITERFVSKMSKEDKEAKLNVTPQSAPVSDSTQYGYKELGTVKDVRGGAKDSLVAFTNTFDNGAGGRYYMGHAQVNKTQDKFTNARAVAHFLMDADLLPNQKHPEAYVDAKGDTIASAYPDKFNANPAVLNDSDRYSMGYKPNPDGSYNIIYRKNSDITPEEKNQYKFETGMRAHSYSDIDWDGQGPSTGFLAKSNYIPLKGGKDKTSIPYKDKGSFSRFSGGSGIYMYKDPKTGKQIGVDVAGSIDVMKQTGADLIKQHGLKPEDLKFLYHDMGSYSAKPKARPDGTLEYKQWENYNTYNRGRSGAPIIIPKGKYGLENPPYGAPGASANLNQLIDWSVQTTGMFNHQLAPKNPKIPLSYIDPLPTEDKLVEGSDIPYKEHEPAPENIGIFDPRRTELHPAVQYANGVMQTVTGVANWMNDMKNRKETSRTYLETIQPKYWENMERYGLNANPIYTKYGGDTFKYSFGDNDPTKPAVSTYKTQAEVDAANAFAKAFTARQFRNGNGAGNPEDTYVATKPGDPVVQFVDSKTGLPFVDKSNQRPKAYTVPNYVNLSDIQGDGSNYWYEDRNGHIVDVDASVLNLKRFKQSQYATGGQAAPIIEAEKGEVFQDTDGDVQQIPNSAPTHEEGGVIVPDVHRVLENTSNLRNDKNSKYLKLSPDKIKELTGLETTKSMSHAQAAAEANKMYEANKFKLVKQIEKAAKGKKGLDKFAENSINLNLQTFQGMPSKQEIFDNLFNHQEAVKQAVGIQTGSKYATGGYNPIERYGNAKTKEGNITPTKQNNRYNLGDEYLQRWERLIPGVSRLGNKEAQSRIYDYMLSSDEGMGRLSEMWRKYGLTNEGRKYKDLVAMTNKGVFNPNRELLPEELKSLKKAYVDGFFGARQAEPFIPEVPEETPPPPNTPSVETPPGITPPVLNPPVKSRFFEPLRWYDTASPVAAYLNALERIPPKYNPAEVHQLRYKLQDPTAVMNANQADFNAGVKAIDSLPISTGVQAANVAQLAASKYAANNQILGQYENQNAQIKNNEITYNTQVRDKQSLLDQAARREFEVNDLDAMAKQDEQKLTALDALMKTYAQNHAFNRNGNLIMKFAPAFDQYANYNGYQTRFAPNPTLGVSNTGPIASSGNRLQELKEGSTYYDAKAGTMFQFKGGKRIALS